MKAIRSKPRRAPSARSEPAVTRALIPLDTAKIREQALADYRKAEQELAKASEQLKKYHEKDVPGFKVWCSRTFGKLFRQLGDLESSLRSKQDMAREIRRLAEWFELDEAEAYRKYLYRRDHPEAAEEEDRLAEVEEHRRQAEAEALRRKRKAEAGADEMDTEEEDEPEPDEEWGELEELFATFLGASARRTKFHPKKAQGDAEARELYRTIVRRLHPDHHGHMNESRKRLWDEAQAAWRSRDADALRGILARSESDGTAMGAQSAVSVILQATKRIKDALRNSKRQIRQLTTRLEWNYAGRKSNPAYARQVETVILDEIRLIRFQLDRLTRSLENLEKEAAKKKRKKRKPVGSGSHP